MKATGDFQDRMNLGNMLEDNLEDFLDEFGFKVIQFGLDTIISNSAIRSKIRRELEYKKSMPVLTLKFAPDFIISSKPKLDYNHIFLLDTKVSITPIFFMKHVKRIEKHSGYENLKRKDLPEIEREAWFTYNTFYDPTNVAILIACPYNPNVFLCEWVSNIKCLWCFKGNKESGPVPWDCNDCPIKTKKNRNFGVVVNRLSGGSGTPQTTIYAGSMRPLEQFLEEEFGLNIDQEYIDSFKGYFKIEKLNKPRGRISWGQYNSAINDIKKYCPWVKNFRPTDKNQYKLNSFTK